MVTSDYEAWKIQQVDAKFSRTRREESREHDSFNRGARKQLLRLNPGHINLSQMPTSD